MGEDPKGALDIPEFLKRAIGKANAQSESEAQMSDMTVDTPDPDEAPAKPRKPRSKANGAVKPAVKAKPAKVKAKPASKPAKAKAKAKAASTGLVDRDKYGFSLGTLKSKAAAMYASKSGATLKEVSDKLGSVQLNLLKGCVAKGFKVIRKKEEGSGSRKVTRYFLK